MVKESKFYEDEKIITVIKNPFVIKHLCCVFNAIKDLIEVNTCGEGNAWFLDCYKVIIGSDNELSCDDFYTFEDAVIAFDQVALTGNDSYGKDYRIICNLIESGVKKCRFSSI